MARGGTIVITQKERQCNRDRDRGDAMDADLHALRRRFAAAADPEVHRLTVPVAGPAALGLPPRTPFRAQIHAIVQLVAMPS
jgi:hypothetical protein